VLEHALARAGVRDVSNAWRRLVLQSVKIALPLGGDRIAVLEIGLVKILYETGIAAKQTRRRLHLLHPNSCSEHGFRITANK
jgi:hypothetical protein